MFCNQCEQTSKGKACTRLGICGKNEAVAIQQDKLVWQLRELAAVALMARDAPASWTPPPTTSLSRPCSPP